MSRPIVGASSISVEHSHADELLEKLKRMNAECVDLRAGWSQAWEDDLDLIASTVRVVFVGAGLVLGSGDRTTPAAMETLEHAAALGIPIRCFCSADVDQHSSDRFLDDVLFYRKLIGSDADFLIEPHGATPSLLQISELINKTDLRAVVDIFGLIRLHEKIDGARAFALKHASCLQVKGVRINSGSSQHVALSSVPRLCGWVSKFVEGFELPITIETKAGTVAEDIRTMRHILESEMSELSNTIPEEILECVCV